VRTYRPGLNLDQDSPAAHPLALADRVLAFERDGKIAEEAFTTFLIEQAHIFAANKGVDWHPCLFYADALQREAELDRTRARDDGDWKALYEREIDALNKRADDAEGLAASYAEDVDGLETQLEEAQSENRQLGAYIETLRQQVQAKTGKSADAGISIPDGYDDLPEWIETNLPGRLALHPRAEHALKDAVYEDAALVYNALLLLGKEYRDMRMRSADDDRPKIAYERRLRELDLRCDGSITKERAGEQGDEYFVNYPVGTAGRRFLDTHLRKGTTKDDRFCLAIYFFWDEAKARAVIGWLPSHLDNRKS
jgi:hypothetical protein